MKNKLYKALLPALLMVVSCQKLDREFVTDLSKNQIETSYDRSAQVLNGVYTELRDGFSEIGGSAMMASATDEAEFTQESNSVQNFNTGNWNAISNPNNVWPAYFEGIRRANFFLESAGKVNLDLLKLDPSLTSQKLYKDRLYEISRWTYEARFLRAFFYFELVKRYGGVPIITKTLNVEDAQTVERSSLADCMKFINSECDSVANKTFTDGNGQSILLPLSYPSSDKDFGRVTRGAALALKSRATLYAASDLFNTPTWASGYANPQYISYTTGSRTQRWQAAADAAFNTITAYNSSTLTSNYPSLFSSANITQNDIIFVRRNTASNTFEKANFPIGLQGNSGTTPSQNLVDAYEVREGTGATQTAVPFDWNNPVHVANIYNTSASATANTRDPRLTFSIAVNDKQLITTAGFSRNLQIYLGGLDGKPTPNATKTGYYIKKYINTVPTGTAVHSWVYFRMAEMYLNYAEAKSELGDQATARDYINKVRARSGVNMPLIPATVTDPAEIKRRIIQERRVEFAFEDHRAWDVRRWMIAPQTLGAPLRGVNIERTGATTFTYTPFVVEQRVFDATKMYLYPIPQGDIISSPKLVQNPGW